MPHDATAVRIRACAKTYPDGTRGLLSTDLDIEPGEVMALLGPSGCGKTTLLRLVAGLEVPDPGSSILFGEQEVTGLSVERREIGMVFQHYALFPQMSVESNIGYGLRIRGVAPEEIRRRVGELVDLVRLNGMEHKRPRELSGGQRQRVALARAIAVRPKVLLLDEPLTALDAKLKESLRDELADLLRRLSITAIHVTHDQQEAMAIADRLAVMQAGQVVQVGSAETLYRSPTHAFVATFLGRVNRLPLTRNPQGQPGVNLGGMWVPYTRPELVTTRATHAQVLVRPEDLQVFALNAQTQHLGQARVLHRTFLGDRTQLQLSTTEGTILLLDLPRDCAFQVGEQVALALDPAAIMACEETS